ncbi:MAG: TonB-dependent receptor [Candidatus Cloacimonetes bacterium]|nr:TonB-dependent receptor [Candidatus Cloacimonadota bacterium]
MNKLFLISVLLFLMILPVTLFSQTGTIAGQVTIEKTGDPLANAAVYWGESKGGTYTKKNGSFIIKDVPVGLQTVTVSFMGYGKVTKQIEVKEDETAIVKFAMIVEAVQLGGVSISATRAIKRETPIAFTDISQENISNVYTTEDVPQLLSGVPGLFSSTGGLGEGELKIRGFDQDKVQILINGIPVNDPESQQVYWSNWTGLSSNIKSVQVQRGAGSSMYGSGVFGGSVNIETIGAGADPMQGWTFRTSAGGYYIQDEVADGKGNMVDFTPYNYNLLLRYNSGNLKGGKFNYSVMGERKVGDSYQIGTTYNGWSFGAEVQNLWGDHKVNTSLIVAPQWHNQARASTDMALQEILGRNYNRNNNKEQENYYNKPQLSVRDEWKISDKTLLMTNFFVTRGDGGGKYLRNDVFDVATGHIEYKPTDDYTDNKYFGRHAYHIAMETGIALDGIEIFWNDIDPIVIDSVYWNDELIDYGYNLINRDYNHSWLNDSQNNHKQFGFNTYLDYTINNMVKLVVGGEARHWKALHRAQSLDFRYNGGNYPQVQNRYDYYGIVTNMSGFARVQIKPIPTLNIMLDGQYAIYKSKVDENPIEIFDFQKGDFTGEYYYATKNMLDDDGELKFEESDYEKEFDFFTPKFGVNYNLTDYLNILANYSIAFKEPRLGDWYSRSGGPDDYQTNEDGTVTELKPEETNTYEAGLGFIGSPVGMPFNLNVNYYNTVYKEKIESVWINPDYITINAGEALHKGVEISANGDINNFDFALSATYGQNRWTDMKVDEIFDEADSMIVDKVVPFAPEQMANFAFGYTFKSFPNDANLRIGLSGNWWDEYYGTYTNEYITGFDTNDDPILEDAKLPYYLGINCDIMYLFKLGGKDASIRLDLKNINNREDNYTRAYYGADYGRNDDLNGIKTMVVNPASMFNAFLTMEVNF